ncbi:MAG: acyl carrier protein [Oscillospiraceae bacterium]|nr:acyl carrier protein [Oscillospiraceae bacterium]
MLEKVVKIIADYQKIDPATITPDSRLVADLGLSSLDVVMLLCQFEDTFGIEIADEDLMSLTNIQSIVDYICTKSK